MSPRTTGILFLIALLLGAFIYLYEIRGGEQDPVAAARQKRLFPDVEAGDIESIELTTTDGRRARVERREDGWWLTAPIPFAADDVAVDAMASQLAQIERAGKVEQAGAPEDFGLDTDSLRFRAEGSEYSLRVGRRTPVGSNTYVRLGSSPEIAFAATWRTQALRKSLTELRDRRVLSFDHVSVSALNVSWPDGRIVAEKRDDGWWITSPVRERADRETIENLLSDLAFLQADDFVDDVVDSQALGLDSPSFRVVLSGEDAEGESFAHELVLGEVRDGSLAAAGRAGAIYRVPAERLRDIPRELIAYRFKDLADFEVSEARRFELVFSDEAGVSERIEGEFSAGDWATKPFSMAPRKVSALLTELARMEAEAIVAEELGESELAAFGLLPPRLVLRAFDASDTVLGDVQLGVRSEEMGWLARRSDASTVFRLDPSLVSDIPESFDALRADFGAEAEAPEEAVAPSEIEQEGLVDVPPAI